MKITYDREADAVSIDLVRRARRRRTDRVAPGVLLHSDSKGRPVELEILMASSRYQLRELERIGSPVEWLTLAEAGAEAKLAPATLRKQIHNGRLNGEKRGHDWFVSRAELATYLETRGRRGRSARKTQRVAS